MIGLLRRAALAVDGGGGDLVGKALAEPGRASDVERLLTRLRDASPEDLLDLRGVDPGPLDQLDLGGAEQLGGVHTRQRPVALADAGSVPPRRSPAVSCSSPPGVAPRASMISSASPEYRIPQFAGPAVQGGWPESMAGDERRLLRSAMLAAIGAVESSGGRAGDLRIGIEETTMSPSPSMDNTRAVATEVTAGASRRRPGRDERSAPTTAHERSRSRERADR